MKKLVGIFVFGLVMVAAPCFSADDEWRGKIDGDMKGGKINPDVVGPLGGPSKPQFDFSINNGTVTMAVNNVELFEKGKDSPPMKAGKIRFTVNGKEAFCEIAGGTGTCTFANPAKAFDAPYVFNFWGYGVTPDGKPGFVGLNPDSVAVTAEPGSDRTKAGRMVDFNTLVASVVFYPNDTFRYGKEVKPDANRKTLPTGILTETIAAAQPAKKVKK